MLTALPQRLPADRVPWYEMLLSRRDRLLASPKFQAWAAKFPLTRRVARREARALFDLCAGFVYAQTLAACVELNLFEILADGPLSADILAARTGLPAASVQILTQAAASLRLLQIAGGKIRLGPLCAATRALRRWSRIMSCFTAISPIRSHSCGAIRKLSSPNSGPIAARPANHPTIRR
jgi:demethylspheroidene O-methyltransferase